VDAGERQITADRSLSALPTSLQATTLFEAHGELVEAAGGVLEFSDLLKRPLEHFRYLQLTLETGEVPLGQQTIQTNVVMIGSCNEVHLAAFREHPEFPSFRGRFELLRAPYLRSVARRAEASTTRRSRRSSGATSRPSRRGSPPSSRCSRG
jgi:serine protein kinase